MKALLVLLLLVLLGAGAAFLFFATGTASLGPAAVTATGPVDVEASEPSASTPAPKVSDENDDETLAPKVSPDGSGREAVTGATRDFQPDPDRWTPVELELPEGHPSGEAVEVWAFFGVSSSARASEGAEWGVDPAAIAREVGADHWARVSMDEGRGELPVPEGATRCVLVPSGRFLMPRAQKVELITAGGQSLRLSPSLGTCLELVLRLPADATAAERDPAGFSFSVVAAGPGRALQARLAHADDGVERSDWSQPNEDLVSMRRGLEPGASLDVLAKAVRFVNPAQQVVQVEANVVTRLEFEPERGGTVVLRAVDETGAAVVQAALGLDEQEHRGRGYSEDSFRVVQTDENGTVVFEGLRAGTWRTSVYADGLTGAEEMLEVVVGETLEHTLTLGRGLVLAGRVEWPDGEPARGARIDTSLVVVRARNGGTSTDYSSEDGTTDDAGSFELSGLPPEAEIQSLVARATVLDAARAAALGASVGDVFRVRLGDVTPSEELVLVLEPTQNLVGRLVDESGEPVSTSFTLVAHPPGGQPWGPDVIRESFGSGVPEHVRLANAGAGLRPGVEAEDPTGEAGAFSLGGLGSGEWTLQVEAVGFLEAAPIQITMPHEEFLELVVARSRPVMGSVVDPEGRPAPGARIALVDDDIPFRFDSGRGTDADEEGRFTLQPETATIEIWATHPDWASSETVLVDPAQLGPEGVVLQLRRGATVRGVVRQPDGSPWEGREVVATDLPSAAMLAGPMGEGPYEPAVTGPDGRFELTAVDPGKLTVAALPPTGEIEQRMAAGDMEQVMMEVMGELLSERVTVADGETVEVDLGAKPKRPVTITGRVLRGSNPAVSDVMVLAEDGPPMMGMRMASSDAEGYYELTVDNPGIYTFIVQEEGSGSNGEPITVTVPEVPQHQQDLRLTTSGIRGRVVDAEGQGLGGVRLSLVPEDGANSALDVFMNGRVETDAGGAFEYSAVRPGTYTLRANVMAEPGDSSVRSDSGHALRSGLRVGEDQVLEDVVLRLGEPGEIEGQVLEPDGTPVPGADVFARDAQGQAVSILPAARSGSGGSFRLQGLAPGDYTLFARRDGRVTREAGTVQVAAGSTATRDLELAPGSFLVLLPERDGEPVRVRASVVDEAGRDWSGLWSPEDLMAWMSDGSPLDEVRVGPLPAGRYTVRAATLDGAVDAKKTLTVREGQEERRVKLRLK